MIEIGCDKKYRLDTGRYEKDSYITLYQSIISEGFITKLKPNNFTVLVVIHAFTDFNGHCGITRSEIAKLTGMTRTAVNKSINELKEYEIGNESVLPLCFR